LKVRAVAAAGGPAEFEVATRWRCLSPTLRSTPPSAEASRIDALRAPWQGAGLVDVDTCAFDVQRTFANFDA